MKRLYQIGTWFLILAAIGWGNGKAQESTDTFSPPVTVQSLGLSGTNISTLTSLSDQQLSVVVNALNATPTISPADLPQSGTFWSLENPDQPPFPTDLIGASAWELSAPQGGFLLDDRSVTANVTTKGARESRATKGSGEFEAAISGPPSPPGGGSGSTNLDDYKGTGVNYGTNLFLAKVAATNGWFAALASNTVPGVAYTIQWATNLLSNNWQSAGEIVGSGLTNWTLWNFPPGNWTNLFVRLRSEISTDGSGIPDWWEERYFGTNAVNPDAQDSAGDGYTIYQKYELGTPPGTPLTPTAPQGFTASYDPNTGAVTLNWLPSPGPITGYLLQKTDEQSGHGFYLTLLTNSTSYPDSIAGDTPNPYEGPVLFVNYSLQAQYAIGASASAYAFIENTPTPQAAYIIGLQGNVTLVIPNPPIDLSYVEVYRQQQSSWPLDFDVYGPYAEDDIATSLYEPLNDGYFSVSASSIANGVCQLPNSQLPPYFNFNIWVQTVRSNGVASGWEQVFGPNPGESVANTPFADGRQQLKDNLRFLLRAADDYPFAFTVDEGGESWSLPPVFACPLTNYVFAGFYGEGGEGYYGAFDELQPIFDNCFYRNFAFAQNILDTNGLVNTGCSGGNSYPIPSGADLPCLTITNYPTYYFDLAGYVTNDMPIPSSQLGSSQTQWILPADGGVGPLNGGTLPLRNFYGLTNVSAKCAYVTNNQLVVTTCYPSQTLPFGVTGVEYIQTAQPIFTNLGYYFARPNYDPVPEQTNFATASTTPAIVVGVGASQQIAGYAKLGIQNGYPGVYAYLGQYFANAYEIGANGVVTATNTGILSPYGDFFATQPGATALVTMPDVDPPYQQGTCTVYSVSLQLDKNHDGNMDFSFNGTDTTSTNSPYIFWANNNFDRWDNDSPFNTPEQDDQQIAFSPLTPTTPTPDCNYSNVLANGYAYRAIPCTRDLEDFARLWVCGITTNLLAQLPSGSTVTLSWGDVGNPDSANPTIDLFTAADANGGIGYLTNEITASNQINAIQSPYVGRLGPGGNIQLNASQFANNWAGNYFIWCGVSNGTGGLVLTIADGSGNTLAQTTAYIQIEDIKQMYEGWSLGDNVSQPPTNTAYLTTVNRPPFTPAFQYPAPQDTNTTYILLVHGYNMKPWEKDRYAETAFKRLYWLGYQGRFGRLGWPTAQNAVNFGGSELQAWQSGQGLLNKLYDLNKEYPGHVYLAAHSLGNLVAGEALLLATNQIVNTYVAMQASVSAHAYDPTTMQYTPLNFNGAPDCYAYYWTNGAPCYFNAAAGAGRYVNFYNTNDWALRIAWLTLFQNAKPVLYPSYSFESPGSYYKNYGFTELYFPGDRYEIFNAIIQTRSYALGMQTNVGGVFKVGSTYNQVNLPGVWPPDAGGYSAHVWHSAEFRSDTPQRWLFWDTFLVQMGLKPSL